MHPELFKLPFIDLTVKCYGVMVVVGFFLSLCLIKKMCKRVKLDPEEIINAGFYAFIVGIVGARVFHVIHYREQFDGILSMLAIWRGGLELLGGVIPAILFIIVYLKVKKMNILPVLDILAAAVMLGIAMGRIGCFLNGCCFGSPTSCPSAVVFPYGSIPYSSQAYPDISRNRTEPIIKLPTEYYGLYDQDGQWYQPSERSKFNYPLKPYDTLDQTQKNDVSKGGKYCAAPIHPTQLYSAAANLAVCALLVLFWAKLGSGSDKRRFTAGTTGALMLVLYSICRFAIEFLRGDNPYETAALTISQLLSIAMFVCGVGMWVWLGRGKCNNKTQIQEK